MEAIMMMDQSLHNEIVSDYKKDLVFEINQLRKKQQKTNQLPTTISGNVNASTLKNVLNQWYQESVDDNNSDSKGFVRNLTSALDNAVSDADLFLGDKDQIVQNFPNEAEIESIINGTISNMMKSVTTISCLPLIMIPII
jgi:hypothetical protein